MDSNNCGLSILKQCKLLELPRSSFYYKQIPESQENIQLMNKIDMLYTSHPALGSRQMTATLNLEGYNVNRKRIQRLMNMMGLEAIFPKKKTSIPNKGHQVYPYLLRNVQITYPLQVWSMDITYIKMHCGFLYLTAVIDWYSRFVLSWRLSNSMASDFCIKAIKNAFNYGIPQIFNTDQGSQFTSENFISILKNNKIQVSMDGRKRALDNIFIERLWRTVKYEEVYLKEYNNGSDAFNGLSSFFEYYNNKRPHSSLGGKTPAQIFLNIN